MSIVLHYRETLLYVDAPEIFVAADSERRAYCCLRIASTAAADRYICAPCSEKQLAELLAGRRTLRSLYEGAENTTLLLADLTEFEQARFEASSAESVPEEWLPGPNFRFPGHQAETSLTPVVSPFHATYLAWELVRRFRTGSPHRILAALADAMVDFQAHQVDAALLAFPTPLAKGAIFADEAGLGKTIEAGLVLAAFWAEHKRNILVVVPAGLRKHWQQELWDKFHLESTVLDGPNFTRLRRNGIENPFAQAGIAICSYHFARRKADFIRTAACNLAVLDEAHRLRSAYRDANKTTQAIAEALAETPKLLLTATPLHSSLADLYSLLTLIDQHLFGDIDSFRRRYIQQGAEKNRDELRERVQGMVRRTTRRQLEGYIHFTRRKSRTFAWQPSDAERALYDGLHAYLRRDRLYALPAGSRRLLSLVLRKMMASCLPIIGETLGVLAKRLQERIHTTEEELKSQEYLKVSEPVVHYRAGGQESLDAEELYRMLRQNYESYNDLHDEWSAGEPPAAAQDSLYTRDDLRAMQAELDILLQCMEQAEALRDKDSKVRVLHKALRTGFTTAAQRKAPPKILILTEFRRTQEYLETVLAAGPFAGRCVGLNGSNSSPQAAAVYRQWQQEQAKSAAAGTNPAMGMRAALLEHFRSKADILIATEAAVEGLNLQFCATVLNYDLPWNPQRIEQRIARCHRYGQQHDVLVINLSAALHPADPAVLQLLADKFRLFKGPFGSGSATLDALESGVEMEQRMLHIYQECSDTAAIGQAVEALRAELDAILKPRMRGAGRKLLEEADHDVHKRLDERQARFNALLAEQRSKLWQLSRFYLESYAQFDESEHSFQLWENPFSSVNIPTGMYSMERGNSSAIPHRSGHPLARNIIERCKALEPPPALLRFNLEECAEWIPHLRALREQSGWLETHLLRLGALDEEEALYTVAIDNDGHALHPEQCRALLSYRLRPVIEPAPPLAPGGAITKGLEALGRAERHRLAEEHRQRTMECFDAEIHKLDRWAGDVIEDMKQRLDKSAGKLNSHRNAARKLSDPVDKIRAQRDITELEAQLRELQGGIFEATNDILARKERILDALQLRLEQRQSSRLLFRFAWCID